MAFTTALTSAREREGDCTPAEMATTRAGVDWAGCDANGTVVVTDMDDDPLCATANPKGNAAAAQYFISSQN
jgi:hypothetical protein